MELITESFDAVIIIGNGFDLNLGMKTSYSDFLKSQEYNLLIKEQNALAHNFRGKEKLQNWIDIENELKTYSKKFGQDNPNFFQEFKDMSSALNNYLTNIEFPEFNKSSQAVRILEVLKGMTSLIIDFNYTNTLSTLCEKLNININNENSNIQHIKIHGTLNHKNLIFGVEDKADIIPEHVFLKKSVNKNFKPIDFSNAILNCDNFVVFGHSLGETDHMYFEDYFKKSSLPNKSNKEQNIVLYHYGEKSYYDLCAQLDKLTLKRITKLKQLNKVDFFDTKNYS